MPLTVNIRHLEQDDVPLKGQLPASELELECGDELVHVHRPLDYDLAAHLAGRDLLITGRLEMALDCECSRCLKPFVFQLKLPDWVLHVPLGGEEGGDVKHDIVDLTPHLREDILLELPRNPLCNEDCAGLPNRLNVAREKASPGMTPNASAWAELNKLKFKK